MAEVFMLQQPFSPSPTDQLSASSPLPSVPTANGDRSTDPASHFVFPLRYPIAEPAADSGLSLPSAQETCVRRSVDRSRPQKLSLNALPAFDFNPSGTSDIASGSSSCTPTRNTPPCTSSAAGHRRNGSELIGGEARAGVVKPLRTSPTHGDFSLTLPANCRNGPPGSRRGHAHRRSGAVSSNDLSDLSKPAHEPRVSSLPATPSNLNDQPRFPSPLDRSWSQPESSPSSQSTPEIPDSDDDPCSNSHARARVGFSDTLEFIPRPLSSVSSETSSSLSTMRPSHSVTNSITSIVAGDATRPSSNKLERPWTRPTLEHPWTEIAHTSVSPTMDDGSECNEELGEKHESLRLPSLPALNSWDWQKSTSIAPSRFAEQLKTDNAATIAENDLLLDDNSPPVTLHATSQMQYARPRTRASNLTRPRSSPEPKIAKRPKKVKSWAESFLARKPRVYEPLRGNAGPADTITSPTSFAAADNMSLEQFSFDDDTTCVIRDTSQISLSKGQYDQDKWKTRDLEPSEAGDMPAQMLDLDAAYGSLSTLSLGYDSDDTAEGGFRAARRRMHSSGATGGFSGPGMHYHRRAESAPEMTPVDYHAFGFPRFGSNPRMADVFEEEEEEENDVEKRNDGDCALLNGSVPSSNLDPKESSTFGLSVVERAGAGISSGENDHQPEHRQEIGRRVGAEQRLLRPGEEEAAVTVKIGDAHPLTDSSVEVVGPEEEPRAYALPKSSGGYVAMAAPMVTRPVSAPIDFAVPNAYVPSMSSDTQSSTAPSPDFVRSSLEIPRLHTASSSITDRMTTHSSRAGDNNNNLCASVDDVPSLTSSASTMTSAQPPRFSGSAYTRSSAERSSSLSAARPAASSKRSSLASLSRLVGNSYGERSKLYIEERAQLESTDRVDKRKGSRISRLMRFWKSSAKPASH